VAAHELRTERLVLRQWREDDRDPWAASNADPEVMRHFPSTLERAACDAFVDRHHALLDERGWGLWGVEVPGVAPFIGFIGLNEPEFEADFTPCVEVGWRLAAPHWGRGYAPEGARAALAHAWDVLGLDEVVSFTAVGNANSRRVMEKLGLALDREFDHPNLPPGHPLRRHVLYRTGRPAP
jgi:RimJ/RimL family protein N-acetyltransferase